MDKRVLAILIIAVVVIAIIVISKLIKKKRKSAKGKIYKTTDGYLSNEPKNKKVRRVVAVEQRKKDGAIAISKIYGAEDKKTDNIVDDLILSPDEHSSLTKKSVVGTRVQFGVKRNGTHKPIFVSDLTKTGDKLTKKEMRKVNKQKGGKKPKNKKTYRATRNKWKQGFKKSKKK